MANTFSHGLSGAIVTYVVLRVLAWALALVFGIGAFFAGPVWFAILVAVVTLAAVRAAQPDIEGWIGRICWGDGSLLYWEAHHGKLKDAFRLDPLWRLHLFEDQFYGHEDLVGWGKKWYMVTLDVLVTLVKLTGLYYLVR